MCRVSCPSLKVFNVDETFKYASGGRVANGGYIPTHSPPHGCDFMQNEIQMVRNKEPELLSTPAAQERIRQVGEAEELLFQRKAAIRQLQDVIDIASNLEVAPADLYMGPDA